MKELFFNELRRFRNTALIATAVHLVLLLLVNQLHNLMQAQKEFYFLILGLYSIAGAGLGLYQFGTYRQPSRWIWLMHRPVPHSRIFAALAAAVLVLVAGAMGLPALLIVAANDLFSAKVVDLRHYMLVPFIILFTTMAWMVGAYIMLSRSRTAFVLAIVPAWLLIHGASAFDMLLPALGCLALLGYVVFKAVKPNRLAPPDTVGSLLAVSLPLHLGFYFALYLMGSLVFQYGQMLFGVHPLNREIDPPGGYTEAVRAETPQLMALGLAASTDPRAAHWRRQVALSEGHSTSPFMPRRFEVRNVLVNVEDMGVTVNGVRWHFSHDTMRLQGFNQRTGAPAGDIGLDGGKPFPTPPIRSAASDDFSYLIMPHLLLGMQTKDSVRTWKLAAFGPDEFISSLPHTYGKRTYLITNQRLIAFNERTDESSALDQQFDIPLPRQFSDLATVDTVQLLDGLLVSFTYGEQLIDGVEGAEQVVYLVDEQGQASEVARRKLAHDFPALFEHRAWWVSPVLQAVASLPGRLYETGRIPDGPRFPAPTVMRPMIAWMAAFAGMLAAAAGAWWWLRRSPLTPRLRLIWMISCLLLGIPALLSLIVLQARTRPLAAPRPAAGTSSPAVAAT